MSPAAREKTVLLRDTAAGFRLMVLANMLERGGRWVLVVAMKWLMPVVVPFFLSVGFAEEAPDWRLELLKESGIPADTATLQNMYQDFSRSGADLDQMVRRLGSDQYQEREQAQREILRMGKPVLPELYPLRKSDAAEVRLRIVEIIGILEAGGRWEKDDLLRQAVSSLLHERNIPGVAKPDRRLFVEFFNKDAPSLAKGYGRLKFQADGAEGGFVRDGIARLEGKREGDGDQQLLLSAKDCTGKPEFSDSFRIEAMIGGDAEGAGGYHVGISVGNVRALFHPGYDSGGFRFEQVSNNQSITGNADMGFTPPAGKALPMNIDVKRLRNRDVEIGVAVISGKDSFRVAQIVKADIIGKLDRIGLDRSGRSGGDALFDALVVDLQ